ncbi:xanthine dehydrogenase family protein molybdopterin-binding subunit [Minwuia sp.]|uniref:xanthine dehydrogenase family protein molybdopterin-binding subunit n=1 Tax=Minwuia sp. TaxID=2493630 RepID=UPI003A93C213
MPDDITHRIEDTRFLTGRGQYTADHNHAGQLHATFVRSPHAHADILGIDVTAAETAPGVRGVWTGRDMVEAGLGTLPCGSQFEAVTPLIVPPRHILAQHRVRHVGEPVAFVVAETAAAAAEAAERVEVDYGMLPATVDAVAALEADASEIWAEAPGNLAFTFRKGDRDGTAGALDAAAHVVELSMLNNRISAMPMEPRAAIASVDSGTGRLLLELTGQGVHGIRRTLASVLNLSEADLDVFAEDVGGGFGLKNFTYPEWALMVWATRKLGRSIKWVSNPNEDLQGTVHGRAMHCSGRLGLDRNGRFLALEVDIVADLGAYASPAGPNASTNAASTAMGGIYDIPQIFMESRGAFTNKVPVDAYRGAGKPEANYIVERLIDAAARRCGFDPVDLRRINTVSSFPHRKALGAVLDSGNYRTNIDTAEQLADRPGLEDRRAASKARGKLRGLGVSCFLESARGAPQEEVQIRFAEDGRIELITGTESNGQGHETAFPQMAAKRLGLPFERFIYRQADTRITRTGFGHGGARSMHMGAGTLALAIDEMLDTARGVAARLLQAEPADVSYDAGRFTAGMDAAVSLEEVAKAARQPEFACDGATDGLDTTVFRENAPFTFPGGCHMAEVEIDPDTGMLEIVRYVAVDDYGHLVNPVLAEGQVHGGLAQGLGQALGENIAYDPDSGQLLSGSLMDYWLPRASDLPAFEVVLDGQPTAANPLGVKGCGQAGCISAPPTVINAILDALAPLGVDHLEMPATSEAIWRVIADAKAATAD